MEDVLLYSGQALKPFTFTHYFCTQISALSSHIEITGSLLVC